jgi:hypothetical protein
VSNPLSNLHDQSDDRDDTLRQETLTILALLELVRIRSGSCTRPSRNRSENGNKI